MLNDMKILDTMSAMSVHAAKRHAVIAENIANADTPGYKAKDVTPFQDIYKTAKRLSQKTSDISADITEVANNGQTSPNGNSVSIEQQMMLSTEVKGQYDMAIAVYKKSLDMMRMAMGKNL